MGIWSKRYLDEEYGLEPVSSFRYFQMYLLQDGRRNLKRVLEDLKKLNNLHIGLNRLREYCRKWKWVKRTKAYDENISQHIKFEVSKQIEKVVSDYVFNASKRLSIYDKHLEKVAVRTDVDPKDQAMAMLRNQEACSKALDDMFKILNNGSEVKKIASEVKLNTKENSFFSDEAIRSIVNEQKCKFGLDE